MRKYNKYNNIRTEVDGVVFASKKEAREWVRLCGELKAGHITALDRQIKYQFPDGFGGLIRHVKSNRPLTYIADFVYIRNGQKIIADAKGHITPEYKIKAALMKCLLGITIVEF